jgi:hypothetical protein
VLNDDRQSALQLRAALLDGLKSVAVLDAIQACRDTRRDAVSHLRDMVPAQVSTRVAAEVLGDDGLGRESWVQDAPNGDVRICSSAEFANTAPPLRFSRNSCLRIPAVSSLLLRAILSAVTNGDVLHAFSSAFDDDIAFKSADIAVYDQGDYLRRHKDTFDRRVFGLVWFFAPDWQPGNGGELVVDSPSGEIKVIAPIQGSVAVMPLTPAFGHAVAPVTDETWRRTSMAVHFGTR